MMNFAGSNERLWWLPLARRVVVWSFVMALLWGWLPFLCGGGLSGWAKSQRAPFAPGGLVTLSLSLLAFLIALMGTTGGALTGALIGFYAPSTEPENPLHSPFFRRVGERTFWLWLLSGAALTSGFSYCVFRFNPLRYGLVHPLFFSYLLLYVALAGILFLLSLCRALQATLRCTDTDATGQIKH